MILTDIPDDLINACKIASEAREFGKKLIVPGAKLLDVTEKIENKIIELGGRIAFPPQISLNHIAAHNYPTANDEVIFKDQICKLDVGAHINGYIGDTATTVDLSGKNEVLIKAVEEALAAAISLAKPGVQLCKIGEVIHAAITKHGISPVRNLSGHGLGVYGIHEPPTVPNYNNGDTQILEKGELIAIEPFSTNGVGLVQEGTFATLFSLVNLRPVRMPASRKILKFINEHYGKLVFAKRWLKKHFKAIEVEFAMRAMVQAGILHAYPPLGEQSKAMVAQAEHTLLIEANGARVLTKLVRS